MQKHTLLYLINTLKLIFNQYTNRNVKRTNISVSVRTPAEACLAEPEAGGNS